MYKKQVSLQNTTNKANISRDGRGLHCKARLLYSQKGYLMFPHVNSIFRINNQKFIKITSITTSVDTYKIKVSTVFLNPKNNQISPSNNPQSLNLQALYRKQPKYNLNHQIRYQKYSQNSLT